MKRVECRDGKFVIDGRERFLFSAEMHYFRVPAGDWFDRLEKIRRAGFDTLSFYVPWFWHETKEGETDFEGRTSPERDLTGFTRLAMEYGFDLIIKPGPYIMSELKNEGLPDWLYMKHPDGIALTIEGKPHPTRVFSYLHPGFLDCVREWYASIAKAIRESDAIMIQLDNEVGMLHWVTSTGDYNPVALAHFREYLTARAPELLAELEAWSYGKQFGFPLNVEYHRFMRQYFREYLETLSRFMDEECIDLPKIINIHGFDTLEYAKRGKNYPIGVSQLKAAADIPRAVLSGDYYIGNIVHENFTDISISNSIMTAVENPAQPLFSAEFQSGFQHDRPKLMPSSIDLSSRLCIAGGMNAINYYLFVGGRNPEGSGLMGSAHDWQAPIGASGELRGSYNKIKELISTVRASEKELLNAKPAFDTWFGFISSYYAGEFFAQDGYPFARIKAHRDMATFDGLLRGLFLLNYTAGAVDLEAVEEIDPTERPILWVFSGPFMPAGVQKKLVRYMESGGRLVLFPSLPEREEHGRECAIIRDRLNVEKGKERDRSMARIFGLEINAFYTESYRELSGLSPFGFDEEGSACAFYGSVGQGEIVMLGCGIELEREYKLEVLRRLCEHLGIERNVEIKGEFVDAWLRKGEGVDFLFLNNYDDYDKTITVKAGDLEFEATVKGREGRIVRLDGSFRERKKFEARKAVF